MRKHKRNPAFNWANGCALFAVLAVVLGMFAVLCGITTFVGISSPSYGPAPLPLGLAGSTRRARTAWVAGARAGRGLQCRDAMADARAAVSTEYHSRSP